MLAVLRARQRRHGGRLPCIIPSGGVDHCPQRGWKPARSAIHYVAPVGGTTTLNRAMANIEPYLFAETALTV